MPQSDDGLVAEIISLIEKTKLYQADEKVTQMQIEKALKEAGFTFHREHVLTKGNIIDFFVFDDQLTIGMEIKTKGSQAAIYKQILRYCKTRCFDHLILATAKSISLPKTLMGTPVTVIKTTKSWL